MYFESEKQNMEYSQWCEAAVCSFHLVWWRVWHLCTDKSADSAGRWRRPWGGWIQHPICLLSSEHSSYWQASLQVSCPASSFCPQIWFPSSYILYIYPLNGLCTYTPKRSPPSLLLFFVFWYSLRPLYPCLASSFLVHSFHSLNLSCWLTADILPSCPFFLEYTLYDVCI